MKNGPTNVSMHVELSVFTSMLMEGHSEGNPVPFGLTL